jgi:hypothetical protein
LTFRETAEFETKRVGEHSRVVRSSHSCGIPECFSRALSTKKQIERVSFEKENKVVEE